MATYQEIIDWIKRNYGFSVKTCWIAHCKEIYEVEGYAGPSPSRKGGERKHPCPIKKREFILSAFIHFSIGMKNTA